MAKVIHKKIWLSGGFVLAAIISIIPLLSLAQEYIPLAPLPDLSTGQNIKGDLGSYAAGIFRLGIGIAGVLAVIMIVVAGIEYMATESITNKGDAKDRLQNAILGLLLALASWLILNTLSPTFTTFSLNIQSPTGQVIPPVGGGQPQPAGYILTYGTSGYRLTLQEAYFRIEFTTKDGEKLATDFSQAEALKECQGTARNVKNNGGTVTLNCQRRVLPGPPKAETFKSYNDCAKRATLFDSPASQFIVGDRCESSAVGNITTDPPYQDQQVCLDKLEQKSAEGYFIIKSCEYKG